MTKAPGRLRGWGINTQTTGAFTDSSTGWERSPDSFDAEGVT